MQTAGILLFSYIHSKYWFIDAIYLTVECVLKYSVITDINAFILLYDYETLMDELENQEYREKLFNLIKDGYIAFLEYDTLEKCMKELVRHFNRNNSEGIRCLLVII